jgi:anti-sigma factor RsiW
MKRPATKSATRPIRHCRDVIGLLSEYMDGGLSPAEIRKVEAHFADCPPCVEFLASLKTTRTAVGSLSERDVPADCRRALRSFLKKSLKPRRV